MHSNELDLTVQVSAAHWAYIQRRTTYLHAMLIRVLRDRHGVPEWYSAAELAELRLPGLPPSRQGISRKARTSGWLRRQGGDYDGERTIRYHVASLPGRAYDMLISRILNLPEDEDDPPAPVTAYLQPELEEPASAPANMAPAWVLPLMRLIKGKAKGDLGVAWKELPLHVPEGVRLPTLEEAAGVLVSLGIAGVGN